MADTVSEQIRFPVFILSYSYQEAKKFFRKNFPGKSVIKDMKYVRAVYDIAGARDIDIILMDGWGINRENNDFVSTLWNVNFLEDTGRARIFNEQDFEKESQNRESI